MQKIIVLFTVATFIAASVRLAQAQQAMKVHRIGYLTIPREVLARANQLIK